MTHRLFCCLGSCVPAGRVFGGPGSSFVGLWCLTLTGTHVLYRGPWPYGPGPRGLGGNRTLVWPDLGMEFPCHKPFSPASVPGYAPEGWENLEFHVAGQFSPAGMGRHCGPQAGHGLKGQQPQIARASGLVVQDPTPSRTIVSRGRRPGDYYGASWYARVSLVDHNTDRQLRELDAAGCDRICTDHGVSGTRI